MPLMKYDPDGIAASVASLNTAGRSRGSEAVRPWQYGMERKHEKNLLVFRAFN